MPRPITTAACSIRATSSTNWRSPISPPPKGLAPKEPAPLFGRPVSSPALDKPKEAASDLDEAVQAAPMNGQIWVTRGQAYERLGDKAKAAAPYNRAIEIRPKDEA